MAVELIPGTSLPIIGPGDAEQVEHRGDVHLRAQRMPPSVLEDIRRPEDLPDGEQHMVDAALRFFNRSRLPRVEFPRLAVNTDATTGNAILQLFEVPQGKQGHLTFCTVDVPGSATIQPAAPFSNAASFAFLAVGPSSSGNQTPAATANVTGLRRGAVGFLPTVSAGPLIPGQWTFNDSNAPVAYGGQAFYYCLIGGSQAGILAQGLVVSARINVMDRE